MENRLIVRPADELDRKLPGLVREIGFIPRGLMKSDGGVYRELLSHKGIKNPFYAGKQLELVILRHMNITDSCGVSDRRHIQHYLTNMGCSKVDKQRIFDIVAKYGLNGMLFEYRIWIPPMLDRPGYDDENYPAVKEFMRICTNLRRGEFDDNKSYLVGEEGRLQSYYAMKEINDNICINGTYGERNPLCVRTDDDAEKFIGAIKTEANKVVSIIDGKE